jgi:hypothetical protein
MNDFNLAPTATGTPYDPVAFMQAQANARRANMPQLPAVTPFSPPPIPALIDPAQGQGQGAAKDPWTQLLERTRPANIDEYRSTADYYKNSILPQMLASSTDDQSARVLPAFEALVAQQGARLFPGQVPAGAPAKDNNDSPLWAGIKTAGRSLWDLGVGVGSGLVETVPAVVALANKVNPATHIIKNMYGTDYGNDFAQYLHGKIGEATTALTSQEGLDAQQKFAERKDTSFGGTISSLASNPGVLPGMVGNTIGAMIPVVASGGLAGGSRLAAMGAGGVVGAGTTGVQEEAKIHGMTREQLLADSPRAKGVFDNLVASGVPQEVADAAARKDLISRTWNIDAPIAGVVNAAGGGIGAEMTAVNKIAGNVAEKAGHGLIRRIAQGALVEGSSEGGLGLAQTAGHNYTQGNPLDQNMGADAALNTSLGALVGGLADGALGKRPVGKSKAVPEAQTTTNPAAGATPGASGAAATAAGAVEADVGIPGVVKVTDGVAATPADSTLVETIGNKLSKQLDPNDKSKKHLTAGAAATPESLLDTSVQKARNIVTGKEWAKLDLKQRADLTEVVYAALAKANNPEEGALAPFQETMTKWKADLLAPPVAPVATPTAEAPTATPPEATPSAEPLTPSPTAEAAPQINNAQQAAAEARAQDIAAAASLANTQQAVQQVIDTTPLKPTAEDVKNVASAVADGTPIETPKKTFKTDNNKAETPTPAPVATETAPPKKTMAKAVAPAPEPAKVIDTSTPTKLPSELAGAKPRYSYGKKQFQLEFASDLDKAAYITSQKTLSKSDAKFRKFLTDQGLTDAEIAARGTKVRDSIKALAKDGKKDTTLRIEESVPPKQEAPAQKTGAAQAVSEASNKTIATLKDGSKVTLIQAVDKVNETPVIYAEIDGKRVGSLDYDTTGQSAPDANVEAAYRRKGVASALYKYAISLGGKVRQEKGTKYKSVRTDSGQALQDNLDRSMKEVRLGSEKSAKSTTSTLRLPASLDNMVKLALKDADLPNSAKEDILSAAKLAQESGDPRHLNELIKEHELDSKTAKELRKLAQEKAKPAAVLEKETIDAVIEDAGLSEGDDLLKIADNYKLRNGVDESLPNEPLNRKTQAILDSVKKGDYTVEQAIRDVNEVTNKTPTSSKGLTSILKRLNREKIGATNTELRAISFATWLLDKAPHLANRMALSVRDMGQTGASGMYSPVNSLVKINASGYNVSTITHEILHHAERMMPEGLQDKIRQEYFARLANKRKQAIAENNKPVLDLIDSIYAWNVQRTADTREAMRSLLLKGGLDGSINADAMYKYTEPSEYWAETASEILNRRHKEDGHWGNQLREWYKEFVENVRSLFGKDNNAQVYKALRAVQNGDGSQQSDTMLSSRDGGFNSENPDLYAPAPPDEGNIFTQSQAKAEAAMVEQKALIDSNTKGDLSNNKPWRTWEKLANNVVAFENLDIAVRKLKLVQTIKTTLADAHRLYNGMTSGMSIQDAEEVGHPLRKYFNDNYEKFGTSFADAVKNVNDFFGAQNMLERLDTAYWYEAKLPVEADLIREGILTDIHDGVGSAAEARRKGKQLSNLVNKYAETSLEDHAGDPYLDNQAILRELKSKGITEDSMAEMNNLSDAVRKRMAQRMVESGQVAADDYVKDFYGWKWYVPQKAPPFKNHSQQANASFDFTSGRPTTKGLHKELMNMQENAREHMGFSPLERLLIDLDRGAERSAYRGLTESAFNLIVDNIKTDKNGKETNPFNAVITKFDGTPYKGYTDEDGNLFSQLSHPEIGFIFHDGNSHYKVQLPANSDMGRAFLGMVSVLKPGKYMAAIGKGTSALARAYTTSSPTWQTAKGAVRELTALPLTVGMELHDNPLKAARLTGAFYKNVAMSWDSLQNAIPTILDGNSKVGMSFEKGDNPTANWVRRYVGSGGSMEINQLYMGGKDGVFKPGLKGRVSNMLDASRTLKQKSVDGFEVLVAPLEFINHYTSNYAKFLEIVPRAMMFKALVEVEGMTDQQAAVQVRSVMDFAQTGLWGRNMNAIWAFSKTSFTSMDTVRRVFRDKNTGGVAYKKGAMWGLAASGLMGSLYFITKALLGVDDNDGVPLLHKFSAETLTQKLIIPMGKGNKPLVFELGLGIPQLIMAPGILAAAVADGHITLKEASKEMVNVLQRNGPIKVFGEGDQNPSDTVGGFWQAVAPTVIAPFVALRNNKTTFGGTIHTVNVDPTKANFEQGKANTPQVYKDIAEWLGVHTPFDWFPEDIRALSINYGGQNARDLLAGAVDNPVKAGIGYDPINPLLSRFQTDEPQFYAVGKVRRALAQATDVMSEVRMAARQSGVATTDAAKKAAIREFLAANPAEAKVYAATEALAKTEAAYHREVSKINKDTLTSVERKQFKRKDLDRNMMAKVKTLEDAMDNL